MEYVIIGNGTAAVACIEGIRSEDCDGGITLISSEKRHCYGRPLISYCLAGAVTKEGMDYRSRDFYEKNKVKALLGKTAEALDVAAKEVVLSSGERVKYGKLLIATGSRPFVPDCDGLEKVKNKFTFMTFDDMEALERALKPKSRVLVVGAGLIGLKCVEGILGRVGSVTVVDLADRVLPSVLDFGGAAIVRKTLEDKGVKFILNDCVCSYSEKTAFLKSGSVVEFDVLVTAVGVRPNTDLVKSAGGEVGRGIVIDAKCATSLKDVYAAGDCSEGYDMTIDGKRILALLPNAYFQGRCAGINMAGGVSSFMNGIPMNAVGFFGVHVLSAGVYEGECVGEAGDSVYRKLFIKDDRLVGFILINDFKRAGIYTSLIRGRVPLSGLDKKLLLQSPQLLAFPEEERRRKLARRV